jgi:4-alpha-glucanotransferase
MTRGGNEDYGRFNDRKVEVRLDQAERLEAWGIDGEYRDYKGEARSIAPETLGALLDLVSDGREHPPETLTVVARPDDPLVLDPGASVVLESGETLAGPDVPDRLPLGYHDIVSEDGETRRLIVSPGACFWPEGMRVWGWALQLYALRSSRSWGMGDLHDLRTFADWAASVGARTALINPLHAVNPGIPQQPSPYYPGSRCFRNPLYLCIEEIAGADGALSDLEHLAAAGRSLNEERRVDRDAVYRLKMRALEILWARRTPDAGFDRYVAEGGETLRRFGVFMTLAEDLGAPWHDWPEEYRRPNAPGSLRLLIERSDRVSFHLWLQWLLDVQLEDASSSLDLIHDLAIGVDPTGVDAWLWQDQLATGASIGAPPDDYNIEGQNWGALGFHPWRLAEAGYDPLVQIIRSSMRHAGGMRFDHVMGLFRLYWILDGSSATEGAYVRYRASEMLDVLALESHRAQAFVIGEDLGTVEPVVREEMGQRNMLSYKLMWFEDAPPSEFPPMSFAAPNTHDLPSTAGMWTRSDVEMVRSVGHDPNEPFLDRIAGKLGALTGLERDASTAQLVTRTYELLAEGSSAIIAASLEDALEMNDRYNVPGTMGDWNWTATLPLPLEEALAHPKVQKLARLLSEARPPG